MKFTKTEAHTFIGKLMEAGFEVSSRVIPERDPNAELQYYVFNVPLYTYADGEDMKRLIALIDEAAMDFSFRSFIKSDVHIMSAGAEMYVRIV